MISHAAAQDAALFLCLPLRTDFAQDAADRTKAINDTTIIVRH